jgi:hypothetical protein
VGNSGTDFQLQNAVWIEVTHYIMQNSVFCEHGNELKNSTQSAEFIGLQALNRLSRNTVDPRDKIMNNPGMRFLRGRLAK